MAEYGIIVAHALSEEALKAGADYVEPPIVNNVVVQHEGCWVRNPEYPVKGSHPSFAILFPGELRLADPDFPTSYVDAYLEAVMPEVARIAQPGAQIVFGSGAARNVPDNVEMNAARRRFAENVRRTRDYAQENDLRILLEPLNKMETNLLNSLQDSADFLDEHSIDGVELVADLYHIMVENEPLSVTRAMTSRIGHAHVADSGRTPPGSGDWPVDEFIEALRGGGYSGNISIECTFHEFPREAREAVAFIRDLDR